MPARRFALGALMAAALVGVAAPAASANVPASIAVYGTGDQAAQPGASFSRPLHVIVTDSGGSPVAGVTVGFEVDSTGSAGAYLSSASAVTNAAGIASVTAVANSHAGFYPVNASVAGIVTQATFNLGNIPTGYAVGDQLASISGPDENGTTQTVSSYLDNGTSYVLLEVSATWCLPSNQEQAPLKTALAYASAHGVKVHMVTMLYQGPSSGTPSTQANAKNWATKYSVSPVLQANGDATGPITNASLYLMGVPAAVPTTMLISPQAKILDFVQGTQTAGGLESRIMHLAAGQVNFFPPFGSSSVGNYPAGVALGEFTGGDQPDLVVANAQDGTVSLLSRNPNNDGYNPAQNFTVGNGPVAIAAGDQSTFSNPGLVPVVVTANYGLPDNGAHPLPGWNNTISVLPANGTGFDAAQPYTVGQGPAAVAIGDVNGDGLPDIVVADNGLANGSTGLGTGNTISVLRHDSSGSGFQAAQTYTVGNGPSGVAIGDINGDGWPDVAVANQNDGTVSVLYGDGQGGLSPPQTWPVGAGVFSIAVADMNGDGRLDIVATDPNDGYVAVLQRNAANTGFDAAQTYPTGAGTNPSGLAVADLNGDGRPDIITGNQFNPSTDHPEDTVTALLRNASNTGFDPPATYTVGSGPAGVAVGDLNGDGKLDIVTASSFTNSSPGSSIDMLYGAYDGAPPVTTDNVSKQWLKSPQAVTLTATDTAGSLTGTASGLAAIHYLIGTSPKDPRNPANHPLTYDPAHKPVLQNGQRIAYSAVDKVGNVEPEVLSRVAHVVTDAQVRTVLSGEIAPSGSLARISAILSHGGFTFSQFRLPAAGTVTLTWVHANGGNLTTVASGKLTLSTNGTGKLVLRLSALGRALLKSASQLSVVGTSRMTIAGRSPVSATKSFTLRS